MKKSKTGGSAIKVGTPEKIFTVFNYMFFTAISLLMIIPFWHVLMTSFSSIEATTRGGLFLWIKGFNLDTYKQVFGNPMIWTGFGTSIIVTLSGTLVGTMITAMAAYALSKKRLRFGKAIRLLIVFTMLFSGGMIPSYLLMKDIKLVDTIWSLILPNMVSAYNVIIMRNFFLSISDSFEESAKLDGANDVRIFFRIILPLSKASFATVALFNAVMYWNDYFSTVLYITTTSKWSLQAVLRYMLTNTQQAMQAAGVSVQASTNVNSSTIKSGSVVVATVPILIVYPFLQKYFVQGVMIGGVKE